jgi:CRAL/TRIO domain
MPMFCLFPSLSDSYMSQQLTGKQFLFGYDTQNRPAVYMLPSRQNTEEGPRQMHHAIWFLERTIDLMPAGTE